MTGRARGKVPMSITDSVKILAYVKRDSNYALIHDWIVSPLSEHRMNTFGMNHRRLSMHAHKITLALLDVFYAITIVLDFTILHSIYMRRSSNSLEDNFAGMCIYEEDLNLYEQRKDSELYYDELTRHSTQHGVFEIQAILEDNIICRYPSAWIGYAYKSLWPFLSVGGEVPPGIHSWANGKRTVFLFKRLPIISQPVSEFDELYS